MKGVKAVFLSAMGALTLGSAIAAGVFFENNVCTELGASFFGDDVVVAYKPVIYLYPESALQVSVRLEPNGEFTCTYPEYDAANGWDVTAEPDGTLSTADGREYGCLFWEARLDMPCDFSEGFCVSGEDTARFLEWALAKQGLTPKERSDFIIYWLPQMQDNPYNVISFQGETYESAAPLAVTPAPDSIKRVFMAYYSAKAPVDIPAQKLCGFDRTGFTVLEWGGTCAE